MLRNCPLAFDGLSDPNGRKMGDDMAEPILIREQLGKVARLTLNRSAALNALSDGMLAALSDALAAIAGDKATKVVVLRGAGRAFCAGHDLKEMQAARANADHGSAYFADLFARCSAVMLAIRALPQPVIAEVHGTAAAAGCQLVASCDLAVAAHDARFAVNGVNIGLFCSTPMVALSRNIAAKPALEMLLTGDMVSADRARDLGLINRVAATGELEQDTMNLANTIAAKLGRAVRIGKRAFYDQISLTAADAYQMASAVMAENMLWRDTDEGVSAFLAKRQPDWPQE